MVEPGKRTNKIRKVFYRTPGGKVKIRYKRKKSKKSSCQICGKKLQGKRPGRAYSKNLCHSCLEEFIRVKTRAKEGTSIPLKFYNLLKREAE